VIGARYDVAQERRPIQSGRDQPGRRTVCRPGARLRDRGSSRPAIGSRISDTCQRLPAFRRLPVRVDLRCRNRLGTQCSRRGRLSHTHGRARRFAERSAPRVGPGGGLGALARAEHPAGNGFPRVPGLRGLALRCPRAVVATTHRVAHFGPFRCRNRTEPGHSIRACCREHCRRADPADRTRAARTFRCAADSPPRAPERRRGW